MVSESQPDFSEFNLFCCMCFDVDGRLVGSCTTEAVSRFYGAPPVWSYVIEIVFLMHVFFHKFQRQAFTNLQRLFVGCTLKHFDDCKQGSLTEGEG